MRQHSQVASGADGRGIRRVLGRLSEGMVAYYSPSGETVEFSGAKPALPVAPGLRRDCRLKKRSAKRRLSFPVTLIRDLSLRSLEPDAPATWFHSLADAFFTSREAPKPTSNIFLRQSSVLRIDCIEEYEEPLLMCGTRFRSCRI